MAFSTDDILDALCAVSSQEYSPINEYFIELKDKKDIYGFRDKGSLYSFIVQVFRQKYGHGIYLAGASRGEIKNTNFGFKEANKLDPNQHVRVKHNGLSVLVQFDVPAFRSGRRQPVLFGQTLTLEIANNKTLRVNCHKS